MEWQTGNMKFLVWQFHRTFARQYGTLVYNGTDLIHPVMISFPGDDEKDAHDDREMC